MFNDRTTRLVNGVKAIGQTSVGFDGPVRSMLNGEFVQIGSDATYYQISACTSTTFTVSPALVVQAADNATIQRVDKYAPIPFDDALDWLGSDDLQDDGKRAELYKMSLRARAMIEAAMDNPIISRSFTELYDIESGRIWLSKTPIISVTLLEVGSDLSGGTFSTVDAGQYTVDTNRGYIYPALAEQRDPILQYRVTWTAGYASAPHDLQELYLEVLQFLYWMSPMGWNMLTSTSAQHGSSVGAPSSPFRSLKDIQEHIMEKVFRYRTLSVK